MTKPALLLAASLLPLLSACNAPAPQSFASTAASEPQASWVGEARQVAVSVPPKLLAVLSTEIQNGGPAHAINVCQVEAPKLARAASEATGWQIRRVSLGNRNPKAVPDAWERAALQEFDRQQAAGADVSKLERAEIVTENGRQVKRYMRALPVQAICLQCHGQADKLGPGVAARLSELYPQDKGTGYLLGQIRGAMTLRQNVQ